MSNEKEHLGHVWCEDTPAFQKAQHAIHKLAKTTPSQLATRKGSESLAGSLLPVRKKRERVQGLPCKAGLQGKSTFRGRAEA